MSNEKHTQEPWRANDAQADIDGPNGEPVAVCYCNDESGDDAKENARRIVACVNACAGIPTDMLERFNAIVVAMYEVSKIEKQRDTLLAALRYLTEAILTNADADYMKRQMDEAVRVLDLHGVSVPVPYKAIASVKGGAA